MQELRQAHPRRQGDIGEAAAIAWLTRAGFAVWVPLGHSPDADLIAERDRQLSRVQVKTSTALRNGRYEVSLATKGGNRSWSGRVKVIDPSRYDYLFVLVADGRQWFIPAAVVEARTMVLLGGPKYAAFEVEGGTAATMGERGFEPL
ncbi:MAG TPA: group I intron-associated PD-(D/E)XK endonuclease [Solirubrobacterales bacterium]